jgi:glycerol uptake facilitator-like aquaporin
LSQAMRVYLAEYLGTVLLVSSVLGAGLMVQRLEAPAAIGLAIIAGCVAAVLFVAIRIFQPISGAHFNPLVTLGLWSTKGFAAAKVVPHVLAQLLGAVSGAVLANLMFDLPAISLGVVDRFGPGIWLGETFSTFGLVLLVLLLVRQGRSGAIAGAVALWIGAGHVISSSTSFANPAVTLGRLLSSSPSGISPGSLIGFLVAQLIGCLLALVIYHLLSKEKENHV